ncbi:MAG TPA: 3-phosphoshikimate 1-carboxyvinyltransferase, partial [Rhabdochlamydiaceae bacterium]
MTLYQVTPSTLSGALTPPPSKSHTLRAILFALMAHGTSKIFNYLASPDIEAMIAAVRTLGAQVAVTPACLEIVGTGGKF